MRLVLDPHRLVFAVVFELERKEPFFASSARDDHETCAIEDWIDSQPVLRDLVDRALAAQSDAEGGGDL